MAWPPTLTELKIDDDVAEDDVRDDDALQMQLDAAVAYVERARPKFNYHADPLSPYPEPTADLRLGTIRLALRWYTRRRSPDLLISQGELGSFRVPSIDPDIERLLRIGRFAIPRVG